MNPQNLTLDEARQRLEDLETYAATSVEAYEQVADGISELEQLILLLETAEYNPEEDTVKFETLELED
ncbi:MAG: hypothetical protein QY314_01720 [Candidatus Dojkabacteria bacterium]|nr:MAG: hypothetical protein QY314_01720 [Candidatus Dojkabacteria bacterium]